MKLLFALLSIITFVTLLHAQPPRVVKVTASNILSEVSEHKKKQPTISASELAAYANELIETRGFDHNYDACDVLSKRDRKSKAEFLHVRQEVSLIGGRKMNLELDVLNPRESMCGECSVWVPAIRGGNREMLLIAEGRRYPIRRPAAFTLDEAELVDSSLKKVLRRWELPYQTVPKGISVDGTKLYLDLYTEYELDDLILELSEDGTLVFRDRAALGPKGEGTWLENAPKDPNNSYLSFMKFKSGNKTYIIRFLAPCT